MPKVKKELAMWFPYPDDPYEGKVHVRHLKAGEIAAIMERTRELKTTYVKEFRQSETAMRIVGAKVETSIAAIKGWENFIDEHDKPMECTPANIKIMCLEDDFLDFIDQCLKTLDDMAAEQDKAEQKN